MSAPFSRSRGKEPLTMSQLIAKYRLLLDESDAGLRRQSSRPRRQQQQQQHKMRRQLSEGDADRADGAIIPDESSGSKSPSSQPPRHQIRTQFRRPTPELLAAVPGLEHPDLNAGQRRYLRSTASIYSVDWAWRALRDGHGGLLMAQELGKGTAAAQEQQRKYTDWIYGHHKRLFETDPSIWRKARPQSIGATGSSRRREERSERGEAAASTKPPESRSAERGRRASGERAGYSQYSRRPQTAAAASRQLSGRQAVSSVNKEPNKDSKVRRDSSHSSADEGQKDLNKIMY